MSHSNVRFNVSGRGIDQLAKALELYEFIHGPNLRYLPTGKKYIPWHGYTLHPNLGMLLHRYEDTNGANTYTPFPFDEGETPETLASFFHNYMKSDKANLEKLPEQTGLYDPFEDFRNDESWDRDAEHDGDNGRGWRLCTGKWGHALDYKTPLLIKPIYLWYGK
jgi:hypothetical protein